MSRGHLTLFYLCSKVQQILVELQRRRTWVPELATRLANFGPTGEKAKESQGGGSKKPGKAKVGRVKSQGSRPKKPGKAKESQ